MKNREWIIEDGEWRARSVLECGSPLPLPEGAKVSAGFQSARGLAQSKTLRIFGALLTFLAITISVHAQSYSINWFKVAGGGGTSTGGTYQVSGIPLCGTSTTPAENFFPGLIVRKKSSSRREEALNE
jgi:hypothetical protein